MLVELFDTRLNTKKVVPPPTKDSFFRSSAFGVQCSREEVIAAIHEIERQELIEAKSTINLALGTGMHRALQDEILPKAKVIVGEWKCLGCAKHFGGPTDEDRKNPMHFNPEQMIACPSSCDECGEIEFAYVEQYFKEEKYKVTGHPDGFLVVPSMKGLGILEAKSIGERGAKEIKDAPKPEHYIQLHLYMWFTGLQWGNILYWDKGKFGLDAFTEHIIERDESTIEAIKNELGALQRGLHFHILPNRICVTRNAPRAQKCACANICFSTED